MGVEVLVSRAFEVVAALNGTVIETDKKESCNEVSIQFGLHYDEPVGVKENGIFEVDSPKGVVEEWPAPMQIHSFYFVRHRPYDDPEIKTKLDQADKEIHRTNRARIQIIDDLKVKRAERADLFAQLDFLKSDRDGFDAVFDEKKKELEPLQQGLGKLCSANSGRGRDSLCSSENELNDLIRSLQYRIQHESFSLAEEKQLLKEMKQLEGTRESVIANATIRTKIQDSLGQKESIQDQVKMMGVDLSELKRDRQVVTEKINSLSEKLRRSKFVIKSLEAELKVVTDKREKAFENIQALRRQRDEGNSIVYQSRTLLTKARELAADGSIKYLEDLSHAEVEKFMSLWNSNKAFRADYKKRILPLLGARQLSQDGRIRNPEEKPLVALEAPTAVETETALNDSSERTNEESCSPECNDAFTKKVKKETGNKGKDLSKSNSDQSDTSESDISRFEKPEKDEKIDEARLKEMKREEELEKARKAMERKRKLQEKAAAKAAIRAQKEAEKRLKEREKKAKKKAAATSPSDPNEAREPVTEASEPEKVEAEASIPVKEKNNKVIPRERSFRYGNRARGAESLPKAIIRRRKSVNYWVWAVPGVAVALTLLVVACFYVR